MIQVTDIPYQLVHAESPKALFIFAHGAGAGKDHEFIVDMTNRLLATNISVLRFDFPYMLKRQSDGKKYPPDRMPVLLTYYEALLHHVCSLDLALPIFVGGKSMGSRVGISVLSEQWPDTIKGGIALGYPFHPQKKPENLRLLPLQSTLKPVLICQGERDALGNKDEIQQYQLSSLVDVAFFTDGDHDLKPRKKSGVTYDVNKAQIINTMVRFIDEHS